MPDFSKVYGNRLVLNNLKNAVAYNRVAHCYMFWGQDGLGKRMVAKAFAKTIQCESEGERPCGMCASCKQVENENHPDVIYVKHEKPSVFGVDDIRVGLNRSIVIKPYKSEKKIYILEDGELLNAQAQNAMLKTIEEPPAYAVILILTSNREVFLPTILSRCVELAMQPVRDGDVIKFLTERGFQIDGKKNEVLRFAGGNIGRAIHFLEDENYQKMVQDIQEVLCGLSAAGSGDIKEYVERLLVYKEQMPLILEQFRLWFRDVFLYKMGASVEYGGEAGRFVREQASHYQYEDLSVILKEIEKFQARLKVNVNMELSMEVLLFALKPGTGLQNPGI